MPCYRQRDAVLILKIPSGNLINKSASKRAYLTTTTTRSRGSRFRVEVCDYELCTASPRGPKAWRIFPYLP